MLLRQLGLENLAGQETFVTGWGLSGFGRMRVRERNNLQVGLVGGEGIGSYLFGLSGASVKTAAGPNVDGTLTVFPTLGWYTGYQHFWSPSALTNVAYGYAHADVPPAMAGATPETTQNAWINLIVKFTAACAVGLEYQYGMLESRDGSRGDDHRLEMVLQVTAPPAYASGLLQRF